MLCWAFIALEFGAGQSVFADQWQMGGVFGKAFFFAIEFDDAVGTVITHFTFNLEPLKVMCFSDILFSSVYLQSPLSSSAGSTVDRTFSSDPSTGTDNTANILSVLGFRPDPRESHGLVRDIPMLIRDSK